MPLFSQDKDRIFGDIWRNIQIDTNITQSTAGSKGRALAEAPAAKIARMWRSFDLNVTQAFLDGAAGEYLDLIGKMMGVMRAGQQPASVASRDMNIKFFVTSGTFGGINGGASITIPKNTVISTEKDSEGVLFKTLNSVVLSATASSMYVSVEAVQTGTIGNVGRNSLKYHNFSNYTDSANDTLKITNDFEVVSAVDRETDINYRYRISNQLQYLARANATSIRLAALSVPGVADVIMIPYAHGIGTFDLIVKSVTPTVSDGLIAAVQSEVAAVKAQGIIANIRKPDESGLSIQGKITFVRRLSQDEERSIIDAATTNLTNYINSLNIGEDFIVNEAVQRVMETSDQIKNIGAANQPFDVVYIYQWNELEDNKIRSKVVGDYHPRDDERLFVENHYAGATPILLTVNR